MIAPIGSAVRLVLEQAFGALDLWRLHATVRPENAGSLRVLERKISRLEYETFMLQ